MTTAPLTSSGYVRGSPQDRQASRGQVPNVLPGALLRPESPSPRLPGWMKGILGTLLVLLTATGGAAEEWKTAASGDGGPSDIFAYVNGEDASFALSCSINPANGGGVLRLLVLVGGTGEFEDYDDAKATVFVQFGDEKMETEIPGVYVDFGGVRQVHAWGLPVLRVARRLRAASAEEVTLRIVPRNLSFAHTVSFPLVGAPAAVDSLASCLEGLKEAGEAAPMARLNFCPRKYRAHE